MARVSQAALLALIAQGAAGNILECAVGFGYQDGVGLCTLCASGRWGNGNGTCVDCSSGRFSSKLAAGEAGDCEPCPQGRWAGERGLTSASHCKSCPMGRYSTTLGATTQARCQECRAGTYSTLPAATSPSVCKVCGAGRYGEEEGAPDRDSCKRCPAGKWSDTVLATTKAACQECPVGTFLPGWGATSAQSCTPCPSGQYGNIAAASKCTACPRGTWSGEAGLSVCQSCPAGRWSAAPSAQSVEDCLACEDPGSCSAGATVFVIVQLEGVDFSGISAEQSLNLKSGFVSVLADAGKLEKSAIRDAAGHVSSVALSGGKGMEASVTLPPGVPPGQLAVALSERPFQEAIAKASSKHQGSHPVVATAEVRPMASGTVSEPVHLQTSPTTLPMSSTSLPASLTTTVLSTSTLSGLPSSGFTVQVQTPSPTTGTNPGTFSVRVQPDDAQDGQGTAGTTLAVPTAPASSPASARAITPPTPPVAFATVEPVPTTTSPADPSGNKTKLDVVQMSADSESEKKGDEQGGAPWIEGYSHLKWWIGFVCLFTCIVTVCVFLDSYESERKDFLRKRFGANRRHRHLESDTESGSSEESAN